MDAGKSWTELASLASAYGCADFGPLPCLAGDEDGRTILVYCTSNSIFFATSGNGGKAWGKPSRAFTFSKVYDGPSVISTKSPTGIAQAHLVVCADRVSGDSEVWYAVYDFSTGGWEKAQNVADILPSEYDGFTHPCFIVRRSDDGGDTCLAWDATDLSNSDQRLIICREIASGSSGSLYGVLRGKSLDDLRMNELQELSTGVDLEGSRPAVAQGFVLEQNYPNPFNPKTGVRFQVPALSGVEGSGVREGGIRGQGPGVSVKLTVYDLLGREVAVLVDERKVPGSYEVSFDGSGLASGAYFYRMTAGSFVQTKRLMLIR
jgi:hypothetical protein